MHLNIANWESSIGRMENLYMAEKRSSPSLLPEALSLFTKLYTQFVYTNALGSGSNQECKCNMSWMSRRNNVKQWHMTSEATGFMYICKFFFPYLFAVWMWMTGDQVCHYRDVIWKVRKLIVLRGRIYLYLQIPLLNFNFLITKSIYIAAGRRAVVVTILKWPVCWKSKK